MMSQNSTLRCVTSIAYSRNEPNWTNEGTGAIHGMRGTSPSRPIDPPFIAAPSTAAPLRSNWLRLVHSPLTPDFIYSSPPQRNLQILDTTFCMARRRQYRLRAVHCSKAYAIDQIGSWNNLSYRLGLVVPRVLSRQNALFDCSRSRAEW